MKQKLCVFCGSSSGESNKYRDLAKLLGELMALNDIDLVYGGASIGLMGVVADSILSKGGQAHGVMPKSLAKLEIVHKKLTSMRVVDTMHQRKQKMYDLSDVFVAIPGGMGTMDEYCEVFTWGQIQYHDKPCYILNFEGYYDHFLAHVKHMNKEGFIGDQHMDILKVVTSPLELMDHINGYFSKT